MTANIPLFLIGLLANVLCVFGLGFMAGRTSGRDKTAGPLIILVGIVLYSVSCLFMVYNSGLFVR